MFKYINYNILFIKEVTSASAGYHVGSLFWLNWNLEMLVFVEEGKPKNTEKIFKARPEPPTNRSTHLGHWAGIELWPH